ncbi:uncharacterized protein LOC133785093 [Humulus lupulus]|uniref:uncharacterized protein LOC133785093 n=1 Tax=Humulus lupulus TaxID=3486 RepID=UPI002B416012|nr:uncharacterized protein LOC133785093 [Humulus lupulus]
MKPWDAYTDFKEKKISSVPIWLQIHGLDLKYWGGRALFKIVGQIGSPLMMDSITQNRERLTYPRVLVEVDLHQDFPEVIPFTNEIHQEVIYTIKYEWIPISCGKCHGMGHYTDNCRKKEEVRKEWVVKKEAPQKRSLESQGQDKDIFVPVKNGRTVIKEVAKAPTTTNTFQILQETGECSSSE